MFGGLASADSLKSEEKYRSLVEYTRVAVCAIDLRGRFTYVNNALANLMGYPVQELLGRPFKDFLYPKDKGKIVRLFLNIMLLRREPRDVEFRVIRKDGRVVHLMTRPTRLKKDGKTVGFQAIITDITELKRAEEALRESEERYRVIVENSPNLVAIYQEGGVLRYVNRAMCERLGWTFEEMTSSRFNTVEKTIPQRFQDMIKKNIAKRLRGEDVPPYELCLKTREGAEIPVMLYAARILYQGKPAVEVILVDITEQKKAEERIRESEEKYRNLFENARDLILTLDLEGNITSANRVLLEYGYDRSEVVGKNVFNIVPKEYWPKFRNGFSELAQGKPVEGELKIKSRRRQGYTIAEYKSSPIIRGNKVVGVQTTVRDVTEREKEEKRVLKQRLFLEAVIDGLSEGFAVIDSEGRQIIVNKGLCEMAGFRREELIGSRPPFKYWAEEGMDEINYAFAQTLKGVQKEWELIFKKKNGDRFWASVYPAKLTDPDGNTIFIATVKDITEHKRMEDALRESEEKYRSLVENINEVVYAIDANGVFSYVSPIIESVLGYSPSEVIGRPFNGFIHQEDLSHVMNRFRKDDSGRLQLKKGLKPVDLRVLTKSGEIRWVRTQGRPIFKEDQYVGIRGVWTDITERKRMEGELRRYSTRLEELVEERTEELQRAERMAAIGETAAMVGHDLRNPLQVITNAVYLGKEAYKTLEPLPTLYRELVEKLGVPELFETIEKQVEYMDKIVSDLQDYARPVRPELAETSLRQLVEGVLSTVTVPETVKVSVMIGDGFPRLMVDPALMRRVLTNLVTNALHAMPDGGQLTVRASRTGDAAFIKVQDTGVGIPREALDKIFHPLFTRKAKGTGFGLAVCRRLVEAHGGAITVKSRVGRGSNFTVKLPIRKEMVS